MLRRLGNNCRSIDLSSKSKVFTQSRLYFSTKPRTDITSDLVLSASMGYTGKDIAKTHTEHADSLKQLNLFQDARIDFVFRTLDKSDFC
jgi:hypothetical protein